MTRTIDLLRPPYGVSPIVEATQPARIIDGYRQTSMRNPAGRLHKRPITLSELTGPLEHARRMSELGTDIAGQGAERAIGQRILVRLRVLDEDGSPVPGTMIEMWQANSAGRYSHPNDSDHAPLDPHFYGAARSMTDASGTIEIRTIRPGAYPVPGTARWWRPAHIHFSVWGKVWLSRLVTQMYFPGDPLHGQDLILMSVPDAGARARLIARELPTIEGPEDALVYEHAIVVRGRAATAAQH